LGVCGCVYELDFVYLYRVGVGGVVFELVVGCCGYLVEVFVDGECEVGFYLDVMLEEVFSYYVCKYDELVV